MQSKMPGWSQGSSKSLDLRDAFDDFPSMKESMDWFKVGKIFTGNQRDVPMKKMRRVPASKKIPETQSMERIPMIRGIGVENYPTHWRLKFKESLKWDGPKLKIYLEIVMIKRILIYS